MTNLVKLARLSNRATRICRVEDSKQNVMDATYYHWEALTIKKIIDNLYSMPISVQKYLPMKIDKINPDLNKEILSSFTGERDGYVHVGPKKYFLTSNYLKQADGYYNMEVRPDDIWVCTFPRCGTTWMQELVWLINNDLDYDKALEIPLIQRFTFLELSLLKHEEFQREILELNNYDPKCVEALSKICEPGYSICARKKSPRHIKTHLPFSLLPPKLLQTSKAIYVTRNPKDVAVSYYYHNRLFRTIGFQSDFSKFWDLFQRDSGLYQAVSEPMFENVKRNFLLWAPFWSHVEEAWNLRTHPNMLFLFYEDMKKDLPSVIRKVAEFCNKILSEEQISKLSDHLKIEKLRNNPSMKIFPDEIKGLTNDEEQGFIRKGKAWKETSRTKRYFFKKTHSWGKLDLGEKNSPRKLMLKRMHGSRKMRAKLESNSSTKPFAA
ncbi:hypothetical protein J437_LFUL002800, partial [Ladona fulva]